MKKLIALIVSLALCMCLIPSVAFAADTKTANSNPSTVTVLTPVQLLQNLLSSVSSEEEVLDISDRLYQQIRDFIQYTNLKTVYMTDGIGFQLSDKHMLVIANDRTVRFRVGPEDNYTEYVDRYAKWQTIDFAGCAEPMFPIFAFDDSTWMLDFIEGKLRKWTLGVQKLVIDMPVSGSVRDGEVGVRVLDLPEFGTERCYIYNVFGDLVRLGNNGAIYVISNEFDYRYGLGEEANTLYFTNLKGKEVKWNLSTNTEIVDKPTQTNPSKPSQSGSQNSSSSQNNSGSQSSSTSSTNNTLVYVQTNNTLSYAGPFVWSIGGDVTDKEVQDLLDYLFGTPESLFSFMFGSTSDLAKEYKDNLPDGWQLAGVFGSSGSWFDWELLDSLFGE